MADPSLRNKLANREFFVAPGVFDMISAVIAREVGFEVVYAPGYWLTASYLGLPDAGLATFTDMLSRVEKVVEYCGAPVIADADTGFGGLLNVQHTVRGYERAGVTAIQIEDQEFPKKCGHTRNCRVVPLDDMVAKIHVAIEARQSDDFLIVARTDSRSSIGLEEALLRGQAFAAAGADMVFIESLTSEEEIAEAASAVDAPLLANMATGGVTPIVDANRLAELGYGGAIYPAMTSLAAGAAIERSLRMLKQHGNDGADQLDYFSFERFCRLIGFEEVWAFEERWKDQLNQ